MYLKNLNLYVKHICIHFNELKTYQGFRNLQKETKHIRKQTVSILLKLNKHQQRFVQYCSKLTINLFIWAYSNLV